MQLMILEIRPSLQLNDKKISAKKTQQMLGHKRILMKKIPQTNDSINEIWCKINFNYLSFS